MLTHGQRCREDGMHTTSGEPQPSPCPRIALVIASFVLATMPGCDMRPGSLADSGGRILLRGSDVHAVGTSESIATVEDLDVLSDTMVWVLNSIEPFFVGFSVDGTVLHEHGREGGGPGEFGAPTGLSLEDSTGSCGRTTAADTP